MAVNIEAYQSIQQELDSKKVTLVAVSKTKPVSDIQTLYNLGQRDFGENYVQELVEKQKQLPADIRWHFIGHLQRNKVKEIAPFVHLIHGADSRKLLVEISKQGFKYGRTIPVLLQVHIAREETKFGLDEAELKEITGNLSGLNNIAVKGLMGMASLTDDRETIRTEFNYLRSLYDQLCSLATYHLPLTTLSMGMSGDYHIAIEEGSNMVRIGSLLFGSRSLER
ncbi:YggS family pyridoxal phosphate-dependent enzyme [Agriterribacter sp.]|uniref:YggS family pyridoxal phosphate-dependent enzyme n=1 Tax=Agriterribacter sp. TaxID=2821509 RepID=UPI002B61489E|nr:YggS family pyridoxal phosphate-dependent enzyme [Agriterribacter sp.]HRO47007.1 YggS family pyridoxal phosphate-dependent enzyme [Agriterribacter sp.]HRQ17841.1 YggS family pyridoxal phosphate-dependent enzyme [Agriterribacter sp.]